MIRQLGNTFVLDTAHTTYAFRVLLSGQLEHLYYGRKIRIEREEDGRILWEKHAVVPANSNQYNENFTEYSLENMRLEMSSYGKGDIREPFIELVHADGSITNDFVYASAEIRAHKGQPDGMPGAYEEDDSAEELVITLKDAQYDMTLLLIYGVFEKRDVFTRAARLINESTETVSLRRLLSLQLDFEKPGYRFTTFRGCWGREMDRHDAFCDGAKLVNYSFTGTSSNRANPFVMIGKADTTEDAGDCYGLNLIYSGNHYEAIEESPYGKTRFVSGINPQAFDFRIGPGEHFDTPEAVMVYSPDGEGGMSRIMHRFVRDCVCRSTWKHKVRPVLLNSWEAAYFDFDEDKLLELAKVGKDVGIELFVMDDGWFGKRNDDHCSLGDWYVNTDKLPNGLHGLSDKINALGLSFGIWVEPEMVNVDSDLYRAHPDWALAIPGKPHSEGRFQRILDLTNPEVTDYLIDAMRGIFSGANIAYVKWDMNRIFSDYFSPALPPERQGEVAHRYVLGLYHMMRTLSQEFPDILFEGCAAGGNRFDLGILSYFPQIWASDDTDALYRVGGQTGYSYGYPMSAVSAHVSVCPNHQTLRTTPLSTRYHVAAFGVCGYECDLLHMSPEDIDEIRAQIAHYKEWREVLLYGDFYRGRNGNTHEWTTVSPDRRRAAGLLMTELVRANELFEQYTPKGLDESLMYRFRDQLLRYDTGETESYTASGSALMYGGVKLALGFGDGGYREELRYRQDFGSRMYFMTAE